jgi:hypothetical protein
MDTSSIEPRLSSYLHAKACRAGTPLSGNFELTARCNRAMPSSATEFMLTL